MKQLPIINAPIHKLTIPSTGEEVNFRPFLVKEEKILLMAKEENSSLAIRQAIETLITNCILNDINIKKLTAYDMEYIFINLRARSVNNIAKIPLSIEGESYTVNINLDDVEVVYDDEHDKIVPIDGTSLVLSLRELTLGDADLGEETDMIVLIGGVIHQIADNDDEESLWNIDEYDEKQRADFIGNLPHSAFEAIQKFIATSPKIEYRKTIKLNNGEDHEVVLSGISDFFTLR